MNRYRVLLEEHGTGRRVKKTVHAESEKEACAVALRSQIGAWFVRAAERARDDA